jgi:hypothetical protein
MNFSHGSIRGVFDSSNSEHVCESIPAGVLGDYGATWLNTSRDKAQEEVFWMF